MKRVFFMGGEGDSELAFIFDDTLPAHSLEVRRAKRFTTDRPVWEQGTSVLEVSSVAGEFLPNGNFSSWLHIRHTDSSYITEVVA